MRGASPGRSIGNRGAHAGQRAWDLASLVHSGQGVEPQWAMRAQSRPTMMVSGLDPPLGGKMALAILVPGHDVGSGDAAIRGAVA